MIFAYALLVLNLTLIERGNAYVSDEITLITGNAFDNAQKAKIWTRELVADDLFLLNIVASSENLREQCTSHKNSMPYHCLLCTREFNSQGGLNRHLATCRRKQNNNAAVLQTLAVQPDAVNENPTPVGEVNNKPNLPDFLETPVAPKNSWNGMDGDEFANSITSAYDEIVKWRKNIFKLPSGAAAKEFVRELTHWLEHFNRGTDFCGISLKVYMILPSLLLQKPSATSKSKEHLAKLAEWLAL